MYAPPPVVPAGGASRGGLAASGPILAICCLLFILFLIASTIVLALIPVYLSRRDGNSGRSRNYLLKASPENFGGVPVQRRDTYTGFDSNQDLDSDSISSTNNPMAAGLNLASGAISISQCKTLRASTRKRRGFGLLREARAPSNNVNLYCLFQFVFAACRRCSSLTYLLALPKSFEMTVNHKLRIPDTFPVGFILIKYICTINFFSSTFPGDDGLVTGTKVTGQITG